jgi:hypothetical protein
MTASPSVLLKSCNKYLIVSATMKKNVQEIKDKQAKRGGMCGSG